MKIFVSPNSRKGWKGWDFNVIDMETISGKAAWPDLREFSGLDGERLS